MNRIRLLLVAVVAVVVGFLAVRQFGSASPEPVGETERQGAVADVPAKGRAKVAPLAKRSPTGVRAAAKPQLVLPEADDEDELTPEQRQLAEAIEKALDEEDFELARSCVKQAVVCPVTEVRQAMVDTLGWFGKRAIPELTSFIADPDEDVAESARSEWEMAIADVEDDPTKIELVEMTMGVVGDADFLESISDEYIGVDEKMAVESLLRVIEGGGSAQGIAKAKETYEFVTGDEFSGREEAERWVREEYVRENDGETPSAGEE